MLARFFIDRPVFAWVIAIIIMMAGGLALKKLPVSQYPTVAPPSIAFNITYPGASAQVIEDTVTALSEQEMNGIERLLYMEAASELGVGTLTLTFEPGTNIDTASVEAQNRYKRVEARQPEDVRRLGVPVTKPQRNYLMFVTLYSPDKSLYNVALGSYACRERARPDPAREGRRRGHPLRHRVLDAHLAASGETPRSSTRWPSSASPRSTGTSRTSTSSWPRSRGCSKRRTEAAWTGHASAIAGSSFSSGTVPLCAAPRRREHLREKKTTSATRGE